MTITYVTLHLSLHCHYLSQKQNEHVLDGEKREKKDKHVFRENMHFGTEIRNFNNTSEAKHYHDHHACHVFIVTIFALFVVGKLAFLD